MLVLLGLVFFAACAAKNNCNDQDRAIFARRGSEFPSLFRSFAGFSVTKSKYEARISEETQLSATCARCYGRAYICGWKHCKWPCVSAGNACNACLAENRCTTRCDKCTGFK